ncbi:MAG: DUF89 family protein [Planctomycetes bacterium]|nr:DUF89 family protein [Planctomycetota bacterium]
MKARPACLPCCLSRALRMCQLVTEDDWLHRKVLGEVMATLAETRHDAAPAELAHEVLRRTARTLGVSDPYADRKALWNEEVLGAEEGIREEIAGAGDPLAAALAASAAANVFDSELEGDPDVAAIRVAAARAELAGEAIEDFRSDLEKARQILFIHDSAVEILLDRILIERIGPERVTSVVRAVPVVADAVEADAARAGFNPGGGIVDPGIDCLGLPLSQCTNRFREIVGRSDLIVAKGQACYETLAGVGVPLYFLLRVKCAVMAEELGLSIGDLVLERA